MDLIKTVIWLLDKFAGVKISRDNFQKNRIPVAVLVLGVTLLLVVAGNMLSVIENLLEISKPPWYSVFAAQVSFVMISVRIILLSLFTRLNNPFGRYKVALIYQILGLAFSVVLNVLLHDLILPSQNISVELKTLYSLLPYVINVMVFFIMRRVYTDKNFREDKYLNSSK